MVAGQPVPRQRAQVEYEQAEGNHHALSHLIPEEKKRLKEGTTTTICTIFIERSSWKNLAKKNF